MSLPNWAGSRWWKCDLHAHTPASGDYGKGPDQANLQARSPCEWLLDHMRAGIDCVAVTDHNSGAWIDRLKSALQELEAASPEGYRTLHLFPGMEISVQGGVHLLAIFASNKTTSDLDALRGAVDLPGAEGVGSSQAVTQKSFSQVVEAIVQAGGIAVPAHVDRDSGLFQMLAGSTLKQALECDQIFAMETVDRSYTPPQLYEEMKLHWTRILGSGSHHPSGNPGQRFPGSKFTWIKMGIPDLSGLHLALLDGPISVRRSDDCPDSPNQHATSVIESVEVRCAKYIGREEPFFAQLNPWLNAIVGGRGTGKSSLVECLRIALRRNDELPGDLKADFEKYGAVYETRSDSGLLTKQAVLRVVYRKDGARFRIQWSPTGNLDAIEVFANEAWSRTEGDVSKRFPIRIFSQRQVFHLAKDPRALLTIVDDAPEVDRRSWNERWHKEKNRFLSLRSRIREVEALLVEEPRLRGDLDDVKRKLAVFEESGQADVLRAFQQRRRQRLAIETWEKTWAGAGDRLRELAADLVLDSLDDTHLDAASSADGSVIACAATTCVSLEAIRKQLDQIANKADLVLASWKMDLDKTEWNRATVAADTAYRLLREKLEAEGVEDPSAYGEFVQLRQSIEQSLSTMKSRKRESESLRTKATESLQRLLEIRRELTDSRRKFLCQILKDNPYVRVYVVPYGGSETVEAEIRDILQQKDGRFERDIGEPGKGGLLGRIYSDGCEIVHQGCQPIYDAKKIENSVNSVKELVRSAAEGSVNSGSFNDQRFAAHIGRLKPEDLDRLDVWFPEDSLDVQYSPAGDGNKYRSIKEGSPGQKTAALLAFLLSYGDEPLVLDQPEDDLDNRLIHELIVRQVRDIKQRRQVVVVTHNPNIVVNGDAELVVGLAARAGATQFDCNGSLQEKQVRDTICTIMEGGRAAFAERYRRIVLNAPGV